MLDKLTDWDAKQRRRLVYLYQLAQDHPTPHGRKVAAIEHARLTQYMADVWDGWQSVKLALWPEKEKV